ncbi:NAC domain-containing protein 17-like [Diospyros lotus]|uniref:NAC domain-containing protein 17-like n=1 Tax=Diospyros lotus TaxID=55363 RepID=UPI00225720DC|nr:NAC domain-containing protein 17-like [Diospyros lotus]
MTVSRDSSCFDVSGCWPPGFRFHPTDEELVLYYLKRKICRRRLKLDIISEVDVYKWDPEELPGQSKLKTGDRQWFFFSPRDRKYPNGARSNRATRRGYWKATGKDRTIKCNSRLVGVKKTLVFYKGRAPSGERTDWVMHEYTLDEEELGRCPTAQDYYALYKVFKKSGPGPKNGEQYGAPFREEEWLDDENTCDNTPSVQENPDKLVTDMPFVDNTKANSPEQPQFDDLEEFIKQLAEGHLHGLPPTLDYGYSLQDIVGDEDGQSTLVDHSLKEANLHGRNIVNNQSGQQNDLWASFDPSLSENSQVQRYETSEVTSAPSFYRQEPQKVEEDFLEDFLEMDDLSGPEPTVQNVHKPVENPQPEDVDGLTELDLDLDIIQDAAMFIRDMGPVPELVSHSYLNNSGSEMVTLVPNSCLNNPENEVVNPLPHSHWNAIEHHVAHVYYNHLESDRVNQVDYRVQPDAGGDSQLWMYKSNSSAVTPAESGTIPPPISGVVFDASSQTQTQTQTQNPSGQENGRVYSWFSSTLWDFVESIPTTPASASEGTALMNRALGRMSSFGRMRMSAGDTRTTSGSPASAPRRFSSSKYDRRFVLLSVFVLLCSILWVLTGTSVKVLRHIAS